MFLSTIERCPPYRVNVAFSQHVGQLYHIQKKEQNCITVNTFCCPPTTIQLIANLAMKDNRYASFLFQQHASYFSMLLFSKCDAILAIMFL